MVWINGRATGHVDSPIWRGGGPHRVRALVDKYEDPADVYRIVFPPHARVRVTLKPRFGNPPKSPLVDLANGQGVLWSFAADFDHDTGMSTSNCRPLGMRSNCRRYSAWTKPLIGSGIGSTLDAGSLVFTGS